VRQGALRFHFSPQAPTWTDGQWPSVLFLSIRAPWAPAGARQRGAVPSLRRGLESRVIGIQARGGLAVSASSPQPHLSLQKVSARSGHPELAGRRHQPRQGGWLKQQNAAAPKRSLDRDMVSEKTARAQAGRHPYNENALR
jgi:hypothetical protein